LVMHTSATQGQSVLPGEPLAVIADTSLIHIQANITETDITRLTIGQRVYVTIDPLSGQQFTGHITEIGRITTAELSGQAMFFNTGGTFTRVTHLIPVKITIADNVNLDNFIGVNARVRIPLRDNIPVPIIPTAPPHFTVSAQGIIESVTSRNVYSMLGQRVERIYVQPGDFVEQGQVLAVLDTADVEFAIQQQRIALTLAQQTGEITVADAQRMLDTAERNLANNTNMMILHAEAALSAADVNVTETRRNLEIIRQDYESRGGMFIVSAETALQHAESALINARTDLAVLEETHGRLLIMYNAGFLAREDVRQSENAVTAARNRYHDAQSAYATATNAQGRSHTEQIRALAQAETMVQSAESARRIAQTLLSAERTAAQQEINHLRSVVSNAVAVTNVEHLEIVLRQLERQLEESTITAPINGTITANHVQEGSIATGLMFTVSDTDNLRVLTGIREQDIGRVYVGMEVTVTAEGTSNATHTGIITRINPAAHPHSPVVEFETEVRITSDNTGLRIGMTARIDVDLEVSQ
jgi:multidrug resistance efflux pump